VSLRQTSCVCWILLRPAQWECCSSATSSRVLDSSSPCFTFAFIFFGMYLLSCIVQFPELTEYLWQDYDGTSPQTVRRLWTGRACRVFFLQTGFMEGHQANGAFVACGPPGFTALALINLGSHARKMLLVIPFSIGTFCPDVLIHLLPFHPLLRHSRYSIAFRSTISSLLFLARSGSPRACSLESSSSAFPSSSSPLACCHTGSKSTSTSMKSLDVSTLLSLPPISSCDRY